MSAYSDMLAARRQALVEQSDRGRTELGAIVGGLEGKFALTETVISVARRLHGHRVLVGAAGVFMVLAPVVARTWFRRALWMLPVALKAYRMVKGRTREGDAD